MGSLARARWRRTALLVAPLAACIDHPFSTVKYETEQQETTSRCIPDPRKVDVLLVIDDSASMASETATLAENLVAFAAVYEDPGGSLDYRIAVTTTDVANPYCESRPEDGTLVSTSCRSRMADFVGEQSHEFDAVDVGHACAEHCTLDAIPFVPTTTEVDDEPRPRPWIERARGRHNLPDGISPKDALPCLGLVGVAGCRFESPLEAAYLAITRSFDPNDPAYGFIRHDAALFVLFVTDEADCSVRPEHADIFDPNGDHVFWPADADEATSTVCWNAAVDCIGGPERYHDCVAVDRNRSGARSSPEDAVLQPLGRYLELLREIEADKQRANATNAQLVFTHVVGGVPVGYETGSVDLSFADSPDPVVQNAFGINPGCIDNSASPPNMAFPPARLREVVAEFGERGARPMASICGADYTPALACVPDSVPLASPCFFGCAADRDPTTPELEPHCTITLEMSSETAPTTLQPCVQRCEGESCRKRPGWDGWEVPPDEDACLLWSLGEHLDQECSQKGYNVGYRILRRDGWWEGSCTEISCIVSDEPSVDCPNLD